MNPTAELPRLALGQPHCYHLLRNLLVTRNGIALGHARAICPPTGREVFGFIVPKGITLQQMRVQHPTATSIIPATEV
jgi:hypothetical protein